MAKLTILLIFWKNRGSFVYLLSNNFDNAEDNVQVVMTDNNKEKDYLSTRKAAEILGVAVSTIQLWTDNGILRGWTTTGGHRRIYRSSVDGILKQRNNPDEQQSSKTKNNVPLKVVLVEDDASQRSLYRKQFEARALEVDLIEASNGYEGLIQIGKYLPSVIITDLMMPDMDGFAMLKALHNIPELKESLIIVASALSKDDVNKKISLPKDVVFFRKPISFDDLEIIILKKIIKTNQI